jgi:hypothetical protein
VRTGVLSGTTVTPGALISTRSALIQRDGDIVGTDGVTPVQLSSLTLGGSYLVAVHHRNHLGVMTGSLVTIAPGMPTIDFSTTATSNYLYPVGNGRQAMWAGNTSGNDNIVIQGIGNDIDPISFDILGFAANTSALANYVRNNVYLNSDVDMDGRVILQGAGNEPDFIIFEVLTHQDNPFHFTNYIIQQQKP